MKPSKKRLTETEQETVAVQAAVGGGGGDDGKFAGISAMKCPDACFKDGTCVISTVTTCKHPCMSADNGCGPITMENRKIAKRIIKAQQNDRSPS